MRRWAGGRNTLLVRRLGLALLGRRIESFARSLFASRLGDLPAQIIGRQCRRRRRRSHGGGHRLCVLIGLSKPDCGHCTIPGAAAAKQDTCENRCDHANVHNTPISTTHRIIAPRSASVILLDSNLVRNDLTSTGRSTPAAAHRSLSHNFMSMPALRRVGREINGRNIRRIGDTSIQPCAAGLLNRTHRRPPRRERIWRSVGTKHPTWPPPDLLVRTLAPHRRFPEGQACRSVSVRAPRTSWHGPNRHRYNRRAGTQRNPLR